MYDLKICIWVTIAAQNNLDTSKHLTPNKNKNIDERVPVGVSP